jgi:hypothetical protein
MVERLHRQLKAAIMCHREPSWTKILNAVLLGIRSAWKEDLQGCIAEMVYGQSLRHPGEFLVSPQHAQHMSPSAFIQSLRQQLADLRPTDGTRHGQKSIFVHKSLRDCKQVFLRHDAVRLGLQPPYDGPYPVVQRSERTMIIRVKGRDMTVSIERVKPAHVLEELVLPSSHITLGIHRQQQPPIQSSQLPSNHQPSSPSSDYQPSPPLSDHQPPPLPSTTLVKKKVSFAMPLRRSQRLKNRMPLRRSERLKNRAS